MLTNRQIKKAIKLLNQNRVIILPTDTIYGLSAIVSLPNEQTINSLKKIEEEKPLIVLFSSFSQIEGFVNLTEQTINYLKSEIPTTVIFELLKFDRTVALRLVKRTDLKTIIDQVGPIFSTSVNFHGQKPLNSFDDLTNFNLKVPVFFDEISQAKPSRIYNSLTRKWIRQ